MFKSVLVANRGEIACRVFKTAQRMGIRTIAVYSQADAEALHARMADEAVLIGSAPARESYLVAEKVLAAAKATGAEAIRARTSRPRPWRRRPSGSVIPS